MKLLDTIKNALFEVEYVEVPAEPKKPKKEKKEKNNDDVKDKPIAKKVLLSRPKKEEKVEPEVVEPEIDGDDFEPTAEREKDFKIMNDNDFKVDDNSSYNDNPKVESLEPEYPEEKPVVHHYNDYEDRRNTYEDNRSYEQPPKREKYQAPREEDNRVIYREPVRERYSTPYGIDETSRNLVQEYGRSAYEKKEEKGGFKPSPIISPIYGVLDKNYRKEDVVQKKEVRLSSYSKENVNLDDVRNKALGVHEERPVEKTAPVKKIEEPEVVEEDDNLLVDLSKDEDKPSVKEVTMGDAMEYFQDLGLEYNVDYVDASKERTAPRRVKDN
ncbi:MAG: hypothetical protein IJ193_07870, partial [Bacilli bacterium]|nr:hypothetical protein [Bacilli bacterium]